MNLFQIPSFVPVPSREVMFNLSIISVIIGICLIIDGLILNNKTRKRYSRMDMYHYWDSDNCKSWNTIIICNF